MEEWLSIPGYEGVYSVSNRGRVKSNARYAESGRHRFLKEKILKPSTSKRGYLRVILSKNGKMKSFLVHKLVLLAFKGECPTDLVCCHNDGNLRNNKLNNLRYDTRSSSYQIKKGPKVEL